MHFWIVYEPRCESWTSLMVQGANYAGKDDGKKNRSADLRRPSWNVPWYVVVMSDWLRWFKAFSD